MAYGINGDKHSSVLIEDDELPERILPTEDKPPYRVPSMAEIAALPWNGLNVISTFAGCGGSSLGYRMAGFRVLWASEFVERARQDYEANARRGTVIDGRDIREVDPLEVLKAVGLKPGELDVLDGSPPCASFSMAGKRQKKWGQVSKYSDREQRTDDLFFEYIRFVRAMQPRAFIAENVSGLVKGTAKGYFLEILAALKACGYIVETRLLDAQWLGVPQARQRIIFQGVREDLNLRPAFPAPLPHRYSVRDALPSLGSGGRLITAGNERHAEAGRRPMWSADHEPSPMITATVAETSIIEPRVLRETGGRNQRREPKNYIDEPIPALIIGHANYTHFQVVYDSGRRGQRPRDITDQPAPTITVGAQTPGAGGGVRNHFKITGGNYAAKGQSGKSISADAPLPTVSAGVHGGGPHQFAIEPEADISDQAIGREYDKLNPGEQSEKYFNLVRSDAAAPSPTITASGGMNSGIACAVHPTEKRKFSIAELKRLCAFPDDFALGGSYAQQWERCGRAVPPLMMRAIAEAVRDRVLRPARGRARTGARAPRSPDRSTSGRSPKGAGRSRASR